MIQIDIPMPKNCAECPCSEYDEIMDEYECNVNYFCRIAEEDARAKRHEKCPLKEVSDMNVGKWISVKDKLPESGKHVLVCCEIHPSKKRYVCDGYYASKHNIATHDVDDDIAYEYDEEADEYFLLEGWYEVIKNWDEYSSIVIADFVTHWMPLPSTEGLDETL